MSSGKAKKAKRAVLNNNQTIESLPIRQQKYMKKTINKLVSEFERKTLDKNIIPTLRAFPCQMLKNKFAYLPDTVKPIQKEDGLWYANDELIVSNEYKTKIELELIKASEAKRKEEETNILKLKPQQLGDI